MEIRNKFVATIEEYNMLDQGDNVVIGVSGGVDSMVLLDLLMSLREEYDLKLHIAHVNHGVRGELALRDQEFVREVARGYGLPFYTRDVNMEDYGRLHKITSEEAGRILRYGFFNEILDQLGGGKIAVAHNLNDQAETLLMRFVRGTGLDGLRGIEYRVDNIIRPILAIERAELEAYIRENNIEITQDHTNFENIYTRNKIRLELIPYLEENFNPNLIKTMERTSKLAEIDSDFLEIYSKELYNRIVKKQAVDQVVMDLNSFKEEHKSIKQRLIRRALLYINGNLQGFSEQHISDIRELFEFGETGKQIDLSNNIQARVSYEDLILEKILAPAEDIGYFSYVLSDKLYLKQLGIGFKVKTHKGKKLYELEKNSRTRYFDLDKIEGQLIVRSRKAGDRFRPFGMRGNKKIKDYFIDEKIPKEERDKIPLLSDSKNILWVVGYRTSDLYKVDSTTENILEVSYIIN